MDRDHLRHLTLNGKQVRSLSCNEKQDGSLYELCMLISLHCIAFFHCVTYCDPYLLCQNLHLIFYFFHCCSSGPISQQGSLNFHFIKSKILVNWDCTFSGKPLNLLCYTQSKLFRVLMSSFF